MARWGDFLQRLRGEAHETDRQRWLAIVGLNRQLAAADSQKQVLTVLVDEAVRLFGAERGFLVAVDGAAPGFVVEVARNLDREAVANPERKLSTTILTRALAAEDGVFSEDAQEGELGAAQSVADLRLRSVLCVPLRVGAQALGCIYLDHRFQAKVFSDRDLPWLAAFADQGAIVLHLHRLLAENRAQAAQLAEQNRSLQATVAAQAEVLAVPAQHLSRADLVHAFPGLLGEAPALLRCLHVLDRVVDTDLPVLLTGESGTGKEVAARALHFSGSRRRGEFVAVNVAAIAANLLESELFGHQKGAFTGADRDRGGLLRQASGGTLFLDEVTEMDLDVQAKLLRALEERRVRPVGGDREHGIDVRVVAATNRDVQKAIAEGRLREDLYFRLAVVTVHLPPLRDRSQDVVALAEHFLAQIAREQALPPRSISPELAAALRARSWPGNLRQLRNEMQRLCALVGMEELRADLLTPEPPLAALPTEVYPSTFDLASIERWAIERALIAAKGNKAEAARLLGIGRRTLYDRLGDSQ
jgi:serine/threonine-protein kinase PknK